MLKKIISILIIFMLMGGVVFADTTDVMVDYGETPDKFIVIDDVAYTLEYANDEANRNEIVEAVIKAKGNIYVFNNGEWFDNYAKKHNLKEVIVFKNKEGRVGAVTGMKDNIDSETEELIYNYETVSEGIKVDGNKILLQNKNDLKYYQLGSKITKDLNDKVYKVFKYYLDSNTRDNIITGEIENEIGNPEGYRYGRINILDKFKNQHIMSFGFADKNNIDWTYDSNFILEISSLQDREGIDNHEVWNFSPHYLYKLKRTIQILFEDKDYQDIYHYVLYQYGESIEKTFKYKTVIDGVTIITGKTEGQKFEVFFKY